LAIVLSVLRDLYLIVVMQFSYTNTILNRQLFDMPLVSVFHHNVYRARLFYIS
jgi:hypothetical protein